MNAPKGHAVVSLDTLRELFSDPQTNVGGALQYRWILNGRVLREFRTISTKWHPTVVEITWLAREIEQHNAAGTVIDLRLEITHEPQR